MFNIGQGFSHNSTAEIIFFAALGNVILGK